MLSRSLARFEYNSWTWKTFVYIRCFYAQLRDLQVDQIHNFGSTKTMFCLKGFQILKHIEAPGESDKLQVPGPHPRD